MAKPFLSELKWKSSVSSPPDAPVATKPFTSWSGKWIWTADPTEGKGDFVYFRREFELSSVPPAAVLRSAADREYALWVNGCFVGRGLISDPRFKRYDTRDVSALLRRGKNCIAALVYHDISIHRWTVCPRGARLFCANWKRVNLLSLAMRTGQRGAVKPISPECALTIRLWRRFTIADRHPRAGSRSGLTMPSGRALWRLLRGCIASSGPRGRRPDSFPGFIWCLRMWPSTRTSAASRSA